MIRFAFASITLLSLVGCADYDLSQDRYDSGWAGAADTGFGSENPDDGYEPNDTPLDAAHLPMPSVTSHLINDVSIDDYYDLGLLDAGSTVLVSLTFLNDEGDLDLYLNSDGHYLDGSGSESDDAAATTATTTAGPVMTATTTAAAAAVATAAAVA